MGCECQNNRSDGMLYLLTQILDFVFNGTLDVNKVGGRAYSGFCTDVTIVPKQLAQLSGCRQVMIQNPYFTNSDRTVLNPKSIFLGTEGGAQVLELVPGQSINLDVENLSEVWVMLQPGAGVPTSIAVPFFAIRKKVI